ncbi:hypothetical protein PIB30_054276 [Stylosanthes scabra]|uniref:WAT1-related protein n=1 Tax=Stylosanthes scabra TaxID=79078 RepID=A0ABU6VIX4_9FABA|nr:hypothetical protein [Stylosanthes scabra]
MENIMKGLKPAMMMLMVQISLALEEQTKADLESCFHVILLWPIWGKLIPKPVLRVVVIDISNICFSGLGSAAGKAKVLGTITGIGGTMLLTFLKGDCAGWGNDNCGSMVCKDERATLCFYFQSSNVSAGSLMLDENLYLGSVIGAVLIVMGLYMVLWGKRKEKKSSSSETMTAVDDRFEEIEVVVSVEK